MAVTLISTGGIYKRIGLLAGGMADLISLQGGTATTNVASGASMATRATNAESYWAESVARSAELGDHWGVIASWRSAQSSLFTGFKAIAEKTLIEQVNADTPLASKDVTSALKELIRQMRAAGTTINSSTVAAGSQTSLGSPVGNAKVVVSLKNAEGYTYQTVPAETLRFTVTSDAQSGGATARNESVIVRGKTAPSSAADYLWNAAGSGCNKTLSLVDSQGSNSRGNILYGSGFDSFNSTNYPSSWVISIGAAGTNVFAAGSSDDYSDGGNALKITGDGGGTLTTLTQTFDTTTNATTAGGGGTPYELKPLTQYAVSLFYKRDNSLSAGTLRVALTDGSGTVTNDAAGNANSFTVDLTAATTSYAHASGTFRTPATIPSTGFKLELKTSVAIDSGDSIFIDDLAMAPTTQLYPGGPSVALFAGSTNVILDDAWTVATTNTLSLMAMWMERFFSLNAKDLIIPNTSSSPTVADSLVA